jgi:hypothetical protein
MGIWNWLFGEIDSTPTPTANGPICPFCEQVTLELPSGAYAVWKSHCGAIGSGCSIYEDLDEVADGLLDRLRISRTVSQPVTPFGKSGMIFAQRYDIPESLRQLEAILHVRGYEMQARSEETESRASHSIWIRRMCESTSTDG